MDEHSWMNTCGWRGGGLVDGGLVDGGLVDGGQLYDPSVVSKVMSLCLVEYIFHFSRSSKKVGSPTLHTFLVLNTGSLRNCGRVPPIHKTFCDK